MTGASKSLGELHAEEPSSSTDDENKGKISRSKWQSFKDSFKSAQVEYNLNEDSTDLEKAIAKTTNSPLSKKLTSRHLQMIAIGGSIGTGLFIGSGSSLGTGGPAGLVIAYCIVGTMVYCTVQSLGELSVAYPVAGSYHTYSTRFIDSSWGFAVGWIYTFGWIIGLPSELVASGIIINYWNSSVNSAAWIAIMYVGISFINFFGVRGYAESEVIFSMIKVLAVVGFVIVGIVITAGGGPTHEYIGAKYWHNPGSFANGFKGVASVFVSAGYSFGGVELTGLASAETKNPTKVLPKAIKQVFWRITLFYIVSLTVVGFLVPYNDSALVGQSSYDVRSSPFVVAIDRAKIKVLPHILNAVILVSVLSVGNSSIYASSRTLVALAEQGQAPGFLTYIDRSGRPLFAIIVSTLVGALGFLVASDKQGTVFSWLLALGGLAAFFNWGSICLAHIRLRLALKAQGRSTDELVFISQTGIIGSIYGLTINTLVLIAQFWIALFPIGSSPGAEAFFEAYLSFPILLVFYLAHKIYRRNWKLYNKLKDIDLDSGKSDIDIERIRQDAEKDNEYTPKKPWWYKVWNFLC